MFSICRDMVMELDWTAYGTFLPDTNPFHDFMSFKGLKKLPGHRILANMLPKINGIIGIIF